MKILRTPDQQFALLDLPAPHYVDIDGLRIAYSDDGPRDAPLVLMLHGEPTWSFLYRTIGARLREAGLRTVAPDLIGFGRSDKPAAIEDYSYARHVGWMHAFLDAIDATQIHLVCQDWGGLIGLRMVGERPERFASVVAMNTALPIGKGELPQAFLDWREFSRTTPEFPIAKIVSRMCTKPLTPEILAAYDAPFPDESYKAGARAFPSLVPITPDDPGAIANVAAWAGLTRFERPFLTIYGKEDPITIGNEIAFQKKIPGAKGLEHAILPGVGHFLQEDAGDEVGRRIAAHVRS